MVYNLILCYNRYSLQQMILKKRLPTMLISKKRHQIDFSFEQKFVAKVELNSQSTTSGAAGIFKIKVIRSEIPVPCTIYGFKTLWWHSIVTPTFKGPTHFFDISIPALFIFDYTTLKNPFCKVNRQCYLRPYQSVHSRNSLFCFGAIS